MLFQNCGESVNSVEGGMVGNAGFDEIVASTYTGNHIFCYIMIFILVHKKGVESTECHVLSSVWKKNEKIPDFKGLTYYSAFYFAGWIFGLSSENVESRSRLQRDSIASSTRSSSTISTENNNAIQIKMEKLRRELEVLQTKVLEERERWLSNSLIGIR